MKESANILYSIEWNQKVIWKSIDCDREKTSKPLIYLEGIGIN